jgi:hypothetical protein
MRQAVRAFIGAVIGGVLYRLRGGPLKDWFPNIFGTQLSRIFWAIPTGALMWHVSGGPIWLLPALIFSHWLALVMVGTGQYLQDVPLRFPDWLGAVRTAIAALPAAFFAPVLAGVYAASGLTHAALYWAGFRTAGNSQAGEILVGVVCWLSILIFWR